MQSLRRKDSALRPEPVFTAPSQNEFYAFPTPVRLAELSIEDLTATGVGYRAPYIAGPLRIFLQENSYLTNWLNCRIQTYTEFDVNVWCRHESRQLYHAFRLRKNLKISG